MEEVIKYLKSLPYPKAIIAVICLFSLVFPGLLFIDQYVARWTTFDTTRLILLDTAVSFPLYLIFWISFLFYFQEPSEGKLTGTPRGILNALLGAGIMLTLVLCFVSYCRFLIAEYVSARGVIGGIVILAIVLLIDAIRDYKGRLRAMETTGGNNT